MMVSFTSTDDTSGVRRCHVCEALHREGYIQQIRYGFNFFVELCSNSDCVYPLEQPARTCQPVCVNEEACDDTINAQSHSDFPRLRPPVGVPCIDINAHFRSYLQFPPAVTTEASSLDAVLNTVIHCGISQAGVRRPRLLGYIVNTYHTVTDAVASDRSDHASDQLTSLRSYVTGMIHTPVHAFWTPHSVLDDVINRHAHKLVKRQFVLDYTNSMTCEQCGFVLKRDVCATQLALSNLSHRTQFLDGMYFTSPCVSCGASNQHICVNIRRAAQFIVLYFDDGLAGWRLSDLRQSRLQDATYEPICVIQYRSTDEGQMYTSWVKKSSVSSNPKQRQEAWMRCCGGDDGLTATPSRASLDTAFPADQLRLVVMSRVTTGTGTGMVGAEPGHPVRPGGLRVSQDPSTMERDSASRASLAFTSDDDTYSCATSTNLGSSLHSYGSRKRRTLAKEQPSSFAFESVTAANARGETPTSSTNPDFVRLPSVSLAADLSSPPHSLSDFPSDRPSRSLATDLTLSPHSTGMLSPRSKSRGIAANLSSLSLPSLNLAEENLTTSLPMPLPVLSLDEDDLSTLPSPSASAVSSHASSRNRVAASHLSSASRASRGHLTTDTSPLPSCNRSADLSHLPSRGLATDSSSISHWSHSDLTAVIPSPSVSSDFSNIPSRNRLAAPDMSSASRMSRKRASTDISSLPSPSLSSVSSLPTSRCLAAASNSPSPSSVSRRCLAADNNNTSSSTLPSHSLASTALSSSALLASHSSLASTDLSSSSALVFRNSLVSADLSLLPQPPSAKRPRATSLVGLGPLTHSTRSDVTSMTSPVSSSSCHSIGTAPPSGRRRRGRVAAAATTAYPYPPAVRVHHTPCKPQQPILQTPRLQIVRLLDIKPASTASPRTETTKLRSFLTDLTPP